LREQKVGNIRKVTAVLFILMIFFSHFVLFSYDSNVIAAEQLIDSNEVNGGKAGLKCYSGVNLAQSFFTASAFTLTRVSLYIKDIGADDPMTVTIYDNNNSATPSDPTDDVPGAFKDSATGNGPLNVYMWVDFNFSIPLSANTRYWIVASSAQPQNDAYRVQDSQADTYPNGNMASVGIPSWVIDLDNDLMFRIYGETSNDVGVEEVKAPSQLEIYDEGNFTTIIKNFGLSNQVNFDVNIVIKDPLGLEVLNITQNIASLDSGAIENISWLFRPLSEGIFNITVTTLLAGDEYTINNFKTITMKTKGRPVLKLHSEITVDGLYTDWNGLSLPVEDTWNTSYQEYLWNDAQGDARGDGNYVYPNNPRFEPGSLDLLEFRAAVDSNSLNFLLIFNSIDDGSGDGTDGLLGFSEQIIHILIDTNKNGTGRTDTLRNARLKLDDDIGWEYALWADGWANGYAEDSQGNIFTSINARGSPVSNAVEISVPLSGFVAPDFEVWRYVVLIGAQDDYSLPGAIEGSKSGFMAVNATETPNSGGGGIDGNGADSNVYDMAFASPQADDLNNYGTVEISLTSHTNITSPQDTPIEANESWAQSFDTSFTSVLSRVDIYAKDVGMDSPQTMIITIQSNDDMGSPSPLDDRPSGINISYPEVADFTAGYEWQSIWFSSPPLLKEGDSYWIVATCSEASGNGYAWGKKLGNPYSGGSASQFFSGSWTQQTYDMIFEVFVRSMTQVDSYQAIHFAPIMINELDVNGSADSEWINIYYNGTDFAGDLVMTDWILSDSDSNDFSFGNFVLSNKKGVTIYTSVGVNTSDELFWDLTFEVWDDFGDDVTLYSEIFIPIDYMSYSNGIIFGDAPPSGLNWGSELGEGIPKNPSMLQTLSLRRMGYENDFYSDWGLNAIGLVEDKTFYLHDDGSFNPNNAVDFMNTTPPVSTILQNMDLDANPGLTFKKNLNPTPEQNYQEFNLTPALASDFNIADDIVLDLWLDNNGVISLESVIVILYDSDGVTKTEIANITGTFLFDAVVGFEMKSLVLPDVVYTIPNGHSLVLYVAADTSTAHNLLLAYNTTTEPSRIRVVPTRTFVNVDWAKTYDITESEKTDFIQSEEVVIRANISDPLGSYDIHGANITIISPMGFTYFSDVPMNLNMTDPGTPSGWKLFDFNFSDTNETGVYTVLVKGVESNGVVHIVSINFTVLGGVAPLLLFPSVTPLFGFTTSSFNFTINYTDLDNDAPDEIYLFINGLGLVNLTEVDPSDTSYLNGKLYFVNLTGFVNGTNYSYYFRARDSKGLWNQSTVLPGPFVLNSPPILSGFNLSPSEGKATTDFNFSVNYTDFDNHPPDSIFVNITGLSHSGPWAMIEADPLDTDYTNGKLYYYNYTGFFNDTYTHHFAANDSLGVWFESPELPGPIVKKTPLMLILASVLPKTGYITTEFNYTVTYLNLDNEAPVSLWVNISGPSHSGPWALIELDPSDTNYFDGKDYYYSYTGLTIGNYTFHFAGESQGIWNETVEFTKPNVLNSPPVLSNYDLQPLVGSASVTIFNYTVTYSDWDNQAPDIMNLNITGPFSGDFTMLEVNSTDTDYADGKEYYYEIILPTDGIYAFKIQANDTGGVWANSIIDSGPGLGGAAPLLFQPNVNPEIGLTNTYFNFTVVFADLQNDSAGTILLNLSGPFSQKIVMQELDPQDLNTTDGKIFYVNITGLLKGQYSFNVEGNDSLGNFTQSPLRDVPLVLNTAPELLGSYINKNNFGGSWFNFSMTYLDIDNDSADSVNLNILGLGNYTFSELDPADNIYSDGKAYYFNITIPKGSYQFRFEASDSGSMAVWNYTMLKWINLTNNVPKITEENIDPSTGFGGDYFNFSANFTDYDNDTLSILLNITGDLTGVYLVFELDALDLTTIDGKYYFTNITLDKGSYNYHFWVFDGDNINESTPIPFIVQNSPPVIVTFDLVNIPEDGTYFVDYNYTDLDGDLGLWSLLTNASFLGIDPIMGILSGNPTNLDVGSYYVNVSIDDGDSGITFHNFTLNVTNVAPVIIAVPITSIFENAPLSDDFDSTDDGQGAIVYTLNTNATWLSINPGTGVLSGIPLSTDIGWYWVNVTVDDGNGGYDSINYSITVENKVPIITTIPITTAFEDFGHIDDFNSDSDIPGVTIYSLSTNASWLTIAPFTGILSSVGTAPDNTHVGWYWVNVTVDDGSGGMGYIYYTLTVINTPPTITTIPITTMDEDTLHIMDFNCDDDIQGNIVYSMQTNATWLNLNPLTGVLIGNTDNSNVGWYWLNVSVSDGNGGIDYVNYNLTVVNIPPVISTIPVTSVLEDTPYLVDFVSSDDGDGIVLYSLLTNASWLSIDPATGVLSGTPDNTNVGSYWVNVTVDDGNLGFDFRNFSLDVINALPTINTTPSADAYEDALYIEDINSIDDGQGNVVYSLTTDANWLSINATSGVLQGTPDSDDIGNYWVNVSVDDGAGGLASMNYSLTVHNTNDAPEIVTTNVVDAEEDLLYSVDYEFTDLDLDPVTWTLNSNATWLSINSNTGELSGTPRNIDVGWYVVNITASDGNLGFDYTEFIITVSNTNDAPSVPELIYPADDSTIDTVLPNFSWNPSQDPDIGDFVYVYTLQYSSSSGFSLNVTTITGIMGTFYQLADPLIDKSTYYWRVEAYDSSITGSGYQSPHFVFDIDTGYRPPAYKGGLKSSMVKFGDSWSVNLSTFFELGSVSENLVFTSSSEDIEIDPDTYIATWKPSGKKDEVLDVIFTVSDGTNNVSSFSIDLTVEKEVVPPTIWERIFWPYPLLSLIVVFVLFGVLTYRKIIYAPKVERVFLIHEHSILITHQSIGKEHELDEDILSGMLAGVKNLISDAFGREEGSDVQDHLRKLEFGDKNILLERGNHFFIAVVFSGRANKDLVSRIKSVITEIEERYSDELKGWEGYTDAFEGIDEIIATLLPKVQVVEEEEVKEEIYVEVPEIDEYYPDGTKKEGLDEPYEEEVYEEEYEDERIIEELPERMPDSPVTVRSETFKDVITEKLIEKEVEEDELDLVLKDYIDVPSSVDTKATLLPPPSKIGTKDMKFKRSGVLSDKEKLDLPPPPWMAKETKSESPKSEDETIITQGPETKIEQKPEMKAPEPVIEPEMKAPEPVLEERPEIKAPAPLVEEKPQVKAPLVDEIPHKKAPEPVLEDKPEIKAPEPDLKASEPAFEDKPDMMAAPLVEDSEVEESEEYEYECPTCESPISGEMTKCPGCGTEIQFEEEYEDEEGVEYECPSCGAAVSPDMTKCPSCGVHFSSD
jgi:hypothetical protein